VIEHRTVDAGGLRVHLAEVGPVDAPPVLLLHGWPQTSHLWREVGPALAADRRVLMPDLRGFGATEAPGTGMDPETFARDQVALLDALGIERVDVVGHDWGGYAGFLLAARWPERVGAYLACSAPSPWVTVTPRLLLDSWRGWYAWLLASPAARPLLARTDVIKRALDRDTRGRVGDDDLEVFAGALRAPERIRATQLLYRSYLRLTVSVVRGNEPVPPLRVPAHLLLGQRDPAIRPTLAEGFPSVELVDTGHFMVDERPELIVARARSVFARAS
jgi:pimeloyl-ACP methyl ester carboxylesterase